MKEDPTLREPPASLDLQGLQSLYQSGNLTPTRLAKELIRRREDYPDPAVWIHRVSAEDLLSRAGELEGLASRGGQVFRDYPLFGIPFAVKDNIDVAGLPTTAACPGFAYRAEAHAPAVERLLRAGAMLVGKTNMDQFATGLNGTRSPYGEVQNTFSPEHISGGSSSGSAVAVAAGLVSFSLGTDTAGSGRVPAGFNNIVGLKPTRGLVSAAGVVPACRSLDCVSVFALTCADAFSVLGLLRGRDAGDAFSREVPADHRLDAEAWLPAPGRFRFGIPDEAHLEFFGDEEYRRLFHEALDRIKSLGGEAVTIPFADFAATARLLYQGPWVAERWAAFGAFLEQHPDSVLPIIHQVVGPGKDIPASAAFAGMARLEELKSTCHAALGGIDFLVVPTAPTLFRRTEIAAAPLVNNGKLGTYTNFVNLLDLCALAIPSGFTPSGLPFGITLVSLPFREGLLSAFGSAYQEKARLPLGRTGAPLPKPAPVRTPPVAFASLAVVGLHLSGQPLNGQLLNLGARLRGRFRTAPRYKLYSLRMEGRHFPGLVRQNSGGEALEVEVWDMNWPALGEFFMNVKPPLVIGSVELSTGESVKGFLCEAHVVAGAEAEDITAHGGWLAYKSTFSA